MGDLRPVERDCHAAVCLGFNSDHPQLFVTGGLGRNDQTLNDGWILDLKSAKWREVSSSLAYSALLTEYSIRLALPRSLMPTMLSSMHACILPGCHTDRGFYLPDKVN